MAILTPQQLLERLSKRLDLLKGSRDADPRQQTLRATIEWSYDLLTTEEQQLFARLSVFAGGCTLEAAEEVCEADLDTLQSLVDKSLLRFTDERFWMLETIRGYARERLEEFGEADEVESCHAERLGVLAREVRDGLPGEAQGAWIRRLDLELDNLRSVLDTLHARGRHEQELSLAVDLGRFWGIRSLWEGRRRLEEALSMTSGVTLERTEALRLVGHMWADHDPVRARALSNEALHNARALGDARLEDRRPEDAGDR